MTVSPLLRTRVSVAGVLRSKIELLHQEAFGTSILIPKACTSQKALLAALQIMKAAVAAHQAGQPTAELLQSFNQTVRS